MPLLQPYLEAATRPRYNPSVSGLPSAVQPAQQVLDLKARHCDGGIVTLGEGIFNNPKEANSKRIAKIFDRRGRHPPKPNDLFLGIRAHLDAFAEQHPQGNFDSEVFRTLAARYVADRIKR